MPDTASPADSRAATAAAICWAVMVAAGPSPAAAQLEPERVYYGINRPIPMTALVPPGAGGEASVQLLEPVTAKVVEKAAVQAGGVDIGAIFPALWTSPARLLYAQLVVGEKKIGPAVVLQPMVTPAYAPTLDPYGDPKFQPEATREKVYSGIRAYVDKQVVLDTSKGEIRIALRPDAAPNTAWNFRQLVEGGLYTSVLVHRVVAMDSRGYPFVIQTGDPVGNGMGGPGYRIDLEPSALPHDFGVVSMARTPSDANTAGSQFFICLSREGTASLDHGYASFGQCVSGADVIQAIAAVPIAPPTQQVRDRPADPPPVIKGARLEDAPPYGEGPPPVAVPGTGPIRK